MSEWHFWETAGPTADPLFSRKTKPRIGSILTHKGTKWHVWYIEEGPEVNNARIEPVTWETDPIMRAIDN
jgi:hypothetical protein